MSTPPFEGPSSGPDPGSIPDEEAENVPIEPVATSTDDHFNRIDEANRIREEEAAARDALIDIVPDFFGMDEADILLREVLRGVEANGNVGRALRIPEPEIPEVISPEWVVEKLQSGERLTLAQKRIIYRFMYLNGYRNEELEREIEEEERRENELRIEGILMNRPGNRPIHLDQQPSTSSAHREEDFSSSDEEEAENNGVLNRKLAEAHMDRQRRVENISIMDRIDHFNDLIMNSALEQLENVELSWNEFGDLVQPDSDDEYISTDDEVENEDEDENEEGEAESSGSGSDQDEEVDEEEEEEAVEDEAVEDEAEEVSADEVEKDEAPVVNGHLGKERKTSTTNPPKKKKELLNGKIEASCSDDPPPVKPLVNGHKKAENEASDNDDDDSDIVEIVSNSEASDEEESENESENEPEPEISKKVEKPSKKVEEIEEEEDEDEKEMKRLLKEDAMMEKIEKRQIWKQVRKAQYDRDRKAVKAKVLSQATAVRDMILHHVDTMASTSDFAFHHFQNEKNTLMEEIATKQRFTGIRREIVVDKKKVGRYVPLRKRKNGEKTDALPFNGFEEYSDVPSESENDNDNDKVEDNDEDGDGVDGEEKVEIEEWFRREYDYRKKRKENRDLQEPGPSRQEYPDWQIKKFEESYDKKYKREEFPNKTDEDIEAELITMAMAEIPSSSNVAGVMTRNRSGTPLSRTIGSPATVMTPNHIRDLYASPKPSKNRVSRFETNGTPGRATPVQVTTRSAKKVPPPPPAKEAKEVPEVTQNLTVEKKKEEEKETVEKVTVEKEDNNEEPSVNEETDSSASVNVRMQRKQRRLTVPQVATQPIPTPIGNNTPIIPEKKQKRQYEKSANKKEKKEEKKDTVVAEEEDKVTKENVAVKEIVVTTKKKNNVKTPKATKAVIAAANNDVDTTTYCSCKKVSWGEMVCCDNMKCTIEWFHFECVGVLSKPKGKWYCPDCRHPDLGCNKPKVSNASRATRQNEKT